MSREGALEPKARGSAGRARRFERGTLASDIRAARIEAELTQTEFAARVGTSQPRIARIESGRVLPNLDMLTRVGEALGRPLIVTFGHAQTAPRRSIVKR